MCCPCAWVARVCVRVCVCVGRVFICEWYKVRVLIISYTQHTPSHETKSVWYLTHYNGVSAGMWIRGLEAPAHSRGCVQTENTGLTANVITQCYKKLKTSCQLDKLDIFFIQIKGSGGCFVLFQFVYKGDWASCIWVCSPVCVGVIV